MASVMVNGLTGLSGAVIKGAYWAKNSPMARRAAIGAAGGLAANMVVNGANGRNPLRGGRNSMLAGGAIGASAIPLLSRLGR
jgi:hypothetical protein